MNKLTGIINQIQKSGAIVLADIGVEGHTFSSMLIDSDEQSNWLKEGNPVFVVFKETEVSLAKDLSGKISMRNHFPCTVEKVVKGELLSEIVMRFRQYTVRSVITSRATKYLDLQPGDVVDALVKANEVALMRIDNHEDNK
jgi:molybdate transport system regulatory protein